MLQHSFDRWSCGRRKHFKNQVLRVLLDQPLLVEGPCTRMETQKFLRLAYKTLVKYISFAACYVEWRPAKVEGKQNNTKTENVCVRWFVEVSAFV